MPLPKDYFRQVKYLLDADLWSSVAETYCDWTNRGFSWEYCDVVGSKLEYIFDLGGISEKTWAIIAAAKLAASHNRWFVMGKVLYCVEGEKSCSVNIFTD